MAAKAAGTRTRKPSAPAAPVVSTDGDWEPIDIEPREDVGERRTLFRLNCEACKGSGDGPEANTECEPCEGSGKIAYTIPVKPGANIALAYMGILAKAGDTPAQVAAAEARAYEYLFDSLLGADGHKALKECDDLGPTDLGRIIATMVKVTMGALEAPKGKQPSE